MDLLAQRHPEKVSTSEFVARTGIAMASLRSGLGGLTRTLKVHFAGLGWPMKNDWGPHVGMPNSEQYYWLTDEIAAEWNVVRRLCGVVSS
jgi:hypothetical protein